VMTKNIVSNLAKGSPRWLKGMQFLFPISIEFFPNFFSSRHEARFSSISVCKLNSAPRNSACIMEEWDDVFSDLEIRDLQVKDDKFRHAHAGALVSPGHIEAYRCVKNSSAYV
jgi:hypothetical protein